MDTKDFLTAVIPWTEGYATIHWHRPGGKFLGRSCLAVEDAIRIVNECKKKGQFDIYFCLSRQKMKTGHRSRDNATALQSVWLDVDIAPDDPNKYSTPAEAIASVLFFCKLLEIPPPSLIVLSGGGLHCYWLSDRILTVDEWQYFANGLKTAARNANLKIDAGVTGDAARVLRVPDTLNYKYDPPRPVRLLKSMCNGKRHDFSFIFAALVKLVPVRAMANGKLGPLPAAFAHLPPADFSKGVEEYPPLDFEPIKAGCPWLREAYETGGRFFDEPQWNLTTLCATFMENGNDLAHKFGNKHPDYSFETTEQKWNSKNRSRRDKSLGWPYCRTIQDSGSRFCSSCPHLSLGKSPLHLGLPAAGDATPEEVEELGGKTSKEFELPKGFCLNESGHICAVVPGKKMNGSVAPTRLLQLARNIITKPSLQHQQGHLGLAFVSATDRGNSHEVFLSSPNCFGNNLFTHLAEKCVLYNENREAKDYMQKLMPSWLDKLRLEQTAQREPGTLGWRYEKGQLYGFAYGGILFLTSGSVMPIVSSAEDEFYSHYRPVGTIEPWLRAAKLLTDRKRPELDTIISIAFASPLMALCGNVYGAILSAWGDPGTSKSTAQQVAAAVWGNPKQTRESLNSTAKSVQGRLGRTKNLPAYWDDIQDEKHQEALFQTMFVATQGAEGGRLNTDATMKERKDWQTLLVACSNASFVEFLIKKQKSTTAGMRRVFEFEYNKKPNEPGIIDALDAHHTFAELEHNYGAMGLEYAKLLTKDNESIRKLLSDITRAFKDSVKGTTDENYWWNMCGTLLTGAALANRLGAEMDVPAMASFLSRAFLRNRMIRAGEGTEGGSWINTEHSLASFLNFHTGSGNSIYTNVTFRHRAHPINILRHPLQGRPVYVHVIRDERKILISKAKFRHYLNENGIQPRQVMDGLVKFLKAREVRMTLGAGTGLGLVQEQVFEILVPNGQHVLEEVLTAHGEPESN